MAWIEKPFRRQSADAGRRVITAREIAMERWQNQNEAKQIPHAIREKRGLVRDDNVTATAKSEIKKTAPEILRLSDTVRATGQRPVK